MIFQDYENLLKIRSKMLDQINQSLNTQRFSELDLTELTKMDERIEQTKHRLKISHNVYDKVYRMKYLECMKVDAIAFKLNYDRSSVYRLLRKIEKLLKVATK